MRTHVLIGVLTIGLIIAGGLLVACGGTAPVQPEEPAEEEQSPSDEGATLLEERCTTCHGLDRVMQAKKTRAEWEQNVARMVDKGAELNEEEQATLVEYLTETYGP